jgi:peptidylprolyl isomerase
MKSYIICVMWLTDGFGEEGRPASRDGAAVPPNAMLHIDLHLVSWKTVIEIGNDKKIQKKILQEGEGYNRPNECANVKGTFYCSSYIV